MLKKILKLKVKLNGVSVPIVIKPETYTVSQKLRVVYAQTYKDLISRGVPTRSSMLDLIKKEGMWGAKEEEKFNELIVQISLLEALLSNLKNDKVKERETVVKLTKLRNELFEIIQIKSDPLDMVAEVIAEEIKVENFLVESTFFDDGKPYFKSYEDFKERRYNEDVEKILNAFHQAINIHNTKVMLELPENKWMMENGVMTKHGVVTDESLWKEIEEGPVEISQEKTVEDLTKTITSKEETPST